VAETIVKRLVCYGFRLNGKAMGRVYLYWWGTFREINAFYRFEYRMFYVLYPFVISLLIVSRRMPD
jgi:hypothetical protein